MGLPNRSKKCEVCNEDFRMWSCEFHKKKYCSRRCLGVANARKAHQARLERIQQIQAGADLPIPRRTRKSKHFPPDYISIDELDDPDELTLEEQEEINKQIKTLHADRFDSQKTQTAFHKFRKDKEIK